MQLIVDRGNTRTKCYLFENNLIVKQDFFFNDNENEILQFLKANKCKSSIISSSSDLPESLLNAIKPKIILNQQTSIPIKLNYETPETLGTDRIAISVGAAFLYPFKNVLSISAGTCITYDLLDNTNTYQGGIIAPGLTIRLQSMHTFTKKLPLLKQKNEMIFPLIGKSTQESMESGVYNAIVAEMKALIHDFKKNYQELTVLITGGDALLFEYHLKNEIFAQPNLQAIGLHRILLYNED